MVVARGEFTVTPLFDGVADKLFRAWANSADGSLNFSTTDSNRLYLGTYAGLEAPKLPKDYNWTLVKGSDGQHAYKIEILATQPYVGRYDTEYGKLYIKVYSGGSEITSSVPAKDLRWRRLSVDTIKDASWNARHSAGAKEIVLTGEDFDLNATFECEYI